ncbi:hypothetical protein [Haladaptatus sp. NG-WS-4]
MAARIPGRMARTRALMTETERKYITREEDVSDSKRYQAIARVRDRLEVLEQDVDALAEHHPKLLGELRDVVCKEND